MVGIFLMSLTFSCLNVVFTIGWRVGCKFRNRWCCSYWGRPLDANSYWGEASWCSWSDVLPMLLLAWILWLAPLCLIIIICNHKYTYNTETITSTLILYIPFVNHINILQNVFQYFLPHIYLTLHMTLEIIGIWEDIYTADVMGSNHVVRQLTRFTNAVWSNYSAIIE